MKLETRKVLVITYYWPPLGGSGVQRWLKFVKYLPSFGVVPFVFTPENPAFDIKDHSLERDVPDEAEVIRFPIWEPYGIFFRMTGASGKKLNTPTKAVGGGGGGFLRKVATWIRGNLLIPDPRLFWVRPSVKFLIDFLKDNEIDTIITTGPPHSLHLIGYRLKKKNPSLRWLADFRDPWSEWGFLDSLGVNEIARRIHRAQEAKVLRSADFVTTITPFYVRRFEALSGRKVHLLTNGFDESDFDGLAPVRTEKYVIRHVGIVNEKCDPRPFMTAIKKAAQENPSFGVDVTVDFVGEVHPAFRAWVEADEFLSEKTTFTSSVPHKTLIRLYNTSSLLLLVLEGYRDAEGYMPGKLFEYIATGLPVLGIGPSNGDAADLMNKTGVGEMIEGKEGKAILDKLLEGYGAWKRGDMKLEKVTDNRECSRSELTRKLVEILES